MAQCLCQYVSISPAKSSTGMSHGSRYTAVCCTLLPLHFRPLSTLVSFCLCVVGEAHLILRLLKRVKAGEKDLFAPGYAM